MSENGNKTCRICLYRDSFRIYFDDELVYHGHFLYGHGQNDPFVQVYENGKFKEHFSNYGDSFTHISEFIELTVILNTRTISIKNPLGQHISFKCHEIEFISEDETPCGFGYEILDQHDCEMEEKYVGESARYMDVTFGENWIKG